MRALTLTQPWAGLVASGLKLVENRPRKVIGRSHLGGLFAIHASREIDGAVYSRIAGIAPDVLKLGSALPEVPCRRNWYRLSRITGAVIGVARVVHELAGGWNEATIANHSITLQQQLMALTGRDDQLRWFFGPVGYLLRDVTILPEPVPCRGMLGFWTLPDGAERAVVRQLGAETANVDPAQRSLVLP